MQASKTLSTNQNARDFRRKIHHRSPKSQQTCRQNPRPETAQLTEKAYASDIYLIALHPETKGCDGWLKRIAKDCHKDRVPPKAVL